MNRSKTKGTSWESEIVRTLIGAGWPYAERRALQGTLDKGDIAGVPGLVIEAKSAERISLPEWFRETETEKANALADIGALWIKRKGKARAEDGYVVIDGATFAMLLKGAGW